MKISELRVFLDEQIEKYGDLEVYCTAPDIGGYDYETVVLTNDLLQIKNGKEVFLVIGEYRQYER